MKTLQSSLPALERFKISVLLKLQDNFRYFVVKMAALLDSDGVGLLGKWFSNLCEVAVMIKLIFYFTRVVDKGKFPSQVGENSLESFLRGVDQASVLNDLVEVGILLSYWIVPDRQGWLQQ